MYSLLLIGWRWMVRFMVNGRTEPDRNYAYDELDRLTSITQPWGGAGGGSLRGPVVGRKVHYGSKSKRGTEVAAIFYTLLKTAKLSWSR